MVRHEGVTFVTLRHGYSLGVECQATGTFGHQLFDERIEEGLLYFQTSAAHFSLGFDGHNRHVLEKRLHYGAELRFGKQLVNGSANFIRLNGTYGVEIVNIHGSKVCLRGRGIK